MPIAAFGPALSHHEVRGEIAGRPVAAESRLVGAEFEEQLAEFGTLASGRDRIAGHGCTVLATSRSWHRVPQLGLCERQRARRVSLLTRSWARLREMTYEHLLVDRDGDITTITLNRPEKRNALALDVMIELTTALRDVGGSDALGVILAANGPVFSAGHNFGDMAGADLDAARHLFAVCTEMMDTVQALPQPVVAVCTRCATAAGCQLVATCDLAVAAESAAFAIPGGKGGLFCHTPLVAVARNVGRKRALEMALTGDPIDAATAADWGLINRVVPDDQLDAAVADLVGRATRAACCRSRSANGPSMRRSVSTRPTPMRSPWRRWRAQRCSTTPRRGSERSSRSATRTSPNAPDGAVVTQRRPARASDMGDRSVAVVADRARVTLRWWRRVPASRHAPTGGAGRGRRPGPRHAARCRSTFTSSSTRRSRGRRDAACPRRRSVSRSARFPIAAAAVDGTLGTRRRRAMTTPHDGGAARRRRCKWPARRRARSVRSGRSAAGTIGIAGRARSVRATGAGGRCGRPTRRWS